jgi:hypothetical protein
MAVTLTEQELDRMAAAVGSESDADLAGLFTELLDSRLTDPGRVLARTCWGEMLRRGWLPLEAQAAVAETVHRSKPNLRLVGRTGVGQFWASGGQS